MLTADDIITNPLPDDVLPHQVTDVIVVCEYLDADGDTLLAYKRSSERGGWRTVGIMQVVLDQLRHDLIDRDGD